MTEITEQVDWATSLLSVHIRNSSESTRMAKWECLVCGWVYDEDIGDPDGGIAAGTKFEDLPDDWVCPMCGAGKDDFEAL
jgi:rubredoxin